MTPAVCCSPGRASIDGMVPHSAAIRRRHSHAATAGGAVPKQHQATPCGPLRATVPGRFPHVAIHAARWRGPVAAAQVRLGVPDKAMCAPP
jgi:hypothetical protein